METPGECRKTEFHLRQLELRMLSRDDEIACQRQLEPPAGGDAVHGCDHGLDHVEPGSKAAEAALRQLPFAARLAGMRQVPANAEGALAHGRQYGHPCLRIGLELVERLAEFSSRGRMQRVH